MARPAKQDLSFRGAENADFEWMLELRRVTMNPHVRAMGEEPIEEINREAVLKDMDCARIVSIGDEDIGMVKLVTRDSPWHLRQIQIAPDFQGQGIGALVLSDILEKARMQPSDIVLNVLKVNPAKRLYERLGFEVVAESDHAYKMEWRV